MSLKGCTWDCKAVFQSCGENRFPRLHSGLQANPLFCCVILDAVSAEQEKTFYLETFGCQMNVHDSEKVIGTLVHQGYRQVESVEEADLVLYNTCSIRDKAEQKVFHRLNDYKRLQAQGKKFAVLGCEIGRAHV